MKRKKKRSKGQERKSQDKPEIKPHLIQSPFLMDSVHLQMNIVLFGVLFV